MGKGLSASSESPIIHVRLSLSNLTNPESRKEPDRIETAGQIPMIPMKLQR